MRAAAAAIAAVAACGGLGNGDPPGIDAGDGVDAAPCVPGALACDNCIDDDGDGFADRDDNECTGPRDDDEGGFGLGLTDEMVGSLLECYGDATSGAGDDGCVRHLCCTLGAADAAACPLGAETFDPARCADPQPARCLAFCEPLTPPACDCFGCCTICDGGGGDCRDIFIAPAFAGCDADTYADPQVCPACVKAADCQGNG